MRKKKFFENLGNVALFGIFTTIVCFVIYSVLSFYLLRMGLQMTNYYALNNGVELLEENPQTIDLPIMQILLFTSLLCSSDVVAAVSIVDYNKQPKLYSCVFGEGCLNDIVSIILFNTVVRLQTVEFQSYTIFVILGQFIMLGVVSLLIGVLFGLGSSYLFKACSFLRGNAILETFVLFSFSMGSYFVSNAIIISGIEMSGIISLLTCGIVQSHYAYYNLSPQGKTCSTLTISFIGTVAEAGVYSYVGIALYAAIATWWSAYFIIAQTVIIIVGRLVAIFFSFYLFRLCFRKKTINFRELTFISYAGMIRGAIAFALVLEIPFNDPVLNDCPECMTKPQYEMLVSSTLILVVITTLVFGTFMGQV